jgi:hypothetical protein
VSISKSTEQRHLIAAATRIVSALALLVGALVRFVQELARLFT